MNEKTAFAVRLLGALEFAAHKHRDQRRKGVEQTPYINHPIQVAEVLASIGQVADDATLLAAVLHDTVEDTETTAAELTDRFGAEVCELVLEVSDDKSLSSDERKHQQVVHAHKLSAKAKLVKIADKICNVRDIGAKPPPNWKPPRRANYLDWAEKVVSACGAVNAELEDYFAECLEVARAALAQELRESGETVT